MITATPHRDASPCPRAEVFVTDVPAGTQSVTLYRTADGSTRVVRGAVEAPTAGTLSRLDLEVPFCVPVTYRAEYLDATGQTIGYETSGAIRLDVAETWLHNPLDVQGAVAAAALATSAQTVSRPANVTFSRPIGAHYAVALAEPRSGIDGFTFDVIAPNADVAARVQAFLGGPDVDLPPVICIRVGREDGLMRIPRPFYLGVSDIVEVDFSVMAGLGGTHQQMTGTEAAPPIPGLAVPLLTRDDIDASFATRDALDGQHLTRSDIDRRYDLAGAAGED